MPFYEASFEKKKYSYRKKKKKVRCANKIKFYIQTANICRKKKKKKLQVLASLICTDCETI